MGEQQKSKKSGGARKIRKREGREQKRARNVAKHNTGDATARGARKAHLTPLDLALMGKGRVQAFRPEWATKKRTPPTRRAFRGEST